MANIKKDKYIGMTNTMNNGMKATIIAYRNALDIDVQFEDGTVVQHKQIDNFKKGRIGHPGRNAWLWKGDKYLGMTNAMNSGMKATIIAYRNNNDIDVQFEDGTIVQHKQIDRFKKGYIGYPKFKRGK